jgi:hypothetical protein
MKLRIKGNSLRFRLTQSEVADFGSRGLVESVTDFGGGQVLRYTLQAVPDVADVTASFDRQTVLVRVPLALAQAWAGGGDVGFRGEMPVAGEGGDVFRILVEKDFQCLKPRPEEDESDHYAHPLAGQQSG